MLMNHFAPEVSDLRTNRQLPIQSPRNFVETYFDCDIVHARLFRLCKGCKRLRDIITLVGTLMMPIYHLARLPQFEGYRETPPLLSQMSQ
jgi:hypothetical protein